MTKMYNPANRPTIIRDRERLADEARALRAALAPRPFPLVPFALWLPILALWVAAFALGYLPTWMGY